MQKHFHLLKQLVLGRECALNYDWAPVSPEEWTWPIMLAAAQSLRLRDGSEAVRSMRYGAQLEAGVLGAYTNATRHIEVAAGALTARSFETCLHEFAHAMLHWDCAASTYETSLAWIEAEADTTADLVLMSLGHAPRIHKFWGLGNAGDLCAFFHFAGPPCIEAAQAIGAALRTASRQKFFVAPIANDAPICLAL